MRKLIGAAALGAAALSLGPVAGVKADQLPAGVEGCIATSPGQTVANPGGPAGSGNIVSANTCSYKATRTGGYAIAAQSWTVKIYTPATNTTRTFSSAAGSNPCNTSPVTAIGDTVTLTVSNGVGAVGNPFPAASDGTLPTPSDGCANLP